MIHQKFFWAVTMVVLTVLVAVGPAGLFAQATPPGRINYQGILRDTSGNPVNGSQTMTFRFYDDPSAGTLLWEELHGAAKPPQVTVDNGLFTVELGDYSSHWTGGTETALTNVFSKHTTVYLAVQVGSDPEMTPRIKVVSAPFAVNSSALGGRDSTAYAKLANADTITADWVNTAHPWSDAEVTNVLTIGAGSTIDPSIAVGNANTLDTFDSSYFLNTSATTQTKAQKLTLNGTVDYGLVASGPTAGAYCYDSNNSGYAYVGYGDYGIKAYGNYAGGYFKDLNNSGYANVGIGDYGIGAYGNVTGGFFKDANSSGFARVGYGDYGIWAGGNTMGGYFFDANNSGYAWVGVGDDGIKAYGNTTGGFFQDIVNSGYAYLGHYNDGIDAYGNTVAGYFEDTDSSGKAWAAYGDDGIRASGSHAGGYFLHSIYSGYAYVGYYDRGIEAYGNEMGGYFKDLTNSGYAYVGDGDEGITAYGNYTGGFFEDLDSYNYAYVGYSTYKINGTGSVSFVQNHPTDKDRVIVYACPEGDEVATYTRGTAKLVNGEARIKLGETFKWVTNPDIGLTAHLTPHGEPVPLAVKSLSTKEMVVVGPKDGPQDITFDYLVYGLRIGFEESSIVQEKQQESYIPSFKDHRERYAKHPELRAYNALERFKGMESSVRGVKASSIDLSRARALKDAIHEYNPTTDPPVDELFGHHGGGEPGAEGTAPESHPHSLPSQPISPPASSTRDVGSRKTPKAVQAVAPAEPVIRGESLPVADSVMAGDVLVMMADNGEALYPCATAADPMVAGIAVTDARDGYAFVAAYGFTVVKADATLHPIAKGDLLVASVIPGHAMRAEGFIPGTVIGKALEPLEYGTGMIKVLVMLR